VEPSATIDDLLERWQALKEKDSSATVEDLCADCPEQTASVKARLQAVASMMSFLGLAPESSGTVLGYDLEKIVTPTSAPIEELTKLAEMAAGRRIMSQGNVVPLSSAEWTGRWQHLQGTGNALLRKAAGEAAPAPSGG
jgi:hypothetical protein